jgi:transcription termination factor Rho
MNERRRPHRRGRGQRPSSRSAESDVNPYRDEDSSPESGSDTEATTSELREARAETEAEPRHREDSAPDAPASDPSQNGNHPDASGQSTQDQPQQQGRNPRWRDRQGGRDRGRDFNRDGGGGGRDGGNFRRGRRNRGRGRGRQDSQPQQQNQPQIPVVAEGETTGWFDAARDGGFIRRAEASYLPQPGDAFVPSQIVRQFALRRGDALKAMIGRDHRGRPVVTEIMEVNSGDPGSALRRPDFSSLTATYPERKLTLETGRPAKGGPELTRRAIDLIAPIGYGQRALIVAPARAGKTMLLHAITEGIALNHPEAVLLILLVDERPEEVSEAISWGVGEVVASSFDMPAERHTQVAEMVLERSRRLVEMGRDVVIVLDSITRMGRAYNTVERGTGRTLSGGLDATAMAKPKAFFGSARSVAPTAGGGSLTIIATALVETGSRMDDVIFEEFKGTGNCEIKLDRSLAEKRIFPAIDIGTSGTRSEDKLFKAEQLDQVYLLRRGLHQMPPQAAMEWLIKRIANTQNNDALLAGL